MPTAARLTFSRVEYANNLRLAKLVREGVPARALENLAEAMALTLPQIADAVQLSRRTFERRVAEDARLKSDESERALRLGRLFALATDVLEDEELAADWFVSPLPELENRTPLETSSTEPGAREVEQVLGRIEHGVFS